MFNGPSFPLGVCRFAAEASSERMIFREKNPYWWESGTRQGIFLLIQLGNFLYTGRSPIRHAAERYVPVSTTV